MTDLRRFTSAVQQMNVTDCQHAADSLICQLSEAKRR
jgi:hypothetical protein